MTAGTAIVVGLIWNSRGYPAVPGARLRVDIADTMMDGSAPISLWSDPFDLRVGSDP
jgi:hypothetical protein